MMLYYPAVHGFCVAPIELFVSPVCHVFALKRALGAVSIYS
jgi:hypothetical protein